LLNGEGKPRAKADMAVPVLDASALLARSPPDPGWSRRQGEVRTAYATVSLIAAVLKNTSGCASREKWA
jgi:hypothetical protein